MSSLSLAWLRRDLRLHDHAVLHEATQTAGLLQPVFVFDREILERFTHKQDRRVSFLAHVIYHLHTQLKSQGGGMLVLYGNPRELMPQLAEVLGAASIISAEDFEPATIARDKAVKAALRPATRFIQLLDHLVMHPASIMKGDGTPYKVFTPYSKAWRAALNTQSFAEKPVKLQGKLATLDAIHHQLAAKEIHFLNADDGADAMLAAIGYAPADLGEWRVDDAPMRLKAFIAEHLQGYKTGRDMMAEAGTSKLSPYLRFGLVSARECARVASHYENAGSTTWVNELIWREFYAQILFHFPDVVADEFQPHYRGLSWDDDARKLAAWQQGKTGFPVVDAAMRQLVQTGWMHNRARMIVASFFTKDFHLDWRLGEEFFAQHLMDYDLASNNGGWQWAASTGTDAQPYFRIFNPELQSKRFDPEARYIKQFVPELAGLKPDDIHALHSADTLFRPASYPAPLVDHHAEKAIAIAMFKRGGEAA